MQLREDPRMSFAHAPTWPPIWMKIDGEPAGQKTLVGEVGILKDVWFYLGRPSHILLMAQDGSQYLSCILFDDPQAGEEIATNLKRCLDMSMDSIGSLTLDAPLGLLPQCRYGIIRRWFFAVFAPGLQYGIGLTDIETNNWRRLQGEIGVLKEVRYQRADPDWIFLVIEHEGAKYIGSLRFDDDTKARSRPATGRSSHLLPEHPRSNLRLSSARDSHGLSTA